MSGTAKGISLRTKMVALLFALVVGPLAIAIVLLLDVNRQAVEDSERNLQASVISEVSATALRLVRTTQGDAEAIAAAIAYAVANPGKEDDALAGVRALLATRGSIAAVRFEVPDAKVNTLLRRDEAGSDDVPSSTAGLRAMADDQGAGLASLGGTRGVIVVPVPRKKGAPGAHGYITAAVEFKGLTEELKSIVSQRFPGAARALIIDGARKSVASYGVEGLAPGGDASKLPVLGALSDSKPLTTRVGVVSNHLEGTQKMIGAIESVPELGWAVAIWRPESEAFAVLETMRMRGLAVAVGALLVALLAGLVAAGAITSPILEIVRQSRAIAGRKWREVTLTSKRGDELGELTRALGQMATDLEAGELEIEKAAKLRGDLSRFLSKDLVSAIVEGRHQITLGGERVDATMLFTDIRSYTTLTEKLTPTEVVELLNAYFGGMVSAVFEQKGTLDKFIGDAIMAVYGAPVPLTDHAYRACCTALEMRVRLAKFNADRKARGLMSIKIGMGISSDVVICGNIGSNERMEYTAIGDGVNLASRLEGATKPYGIDIMISEFTYAKVEGQVRVREMDLIRVKGKTKPVRVYELIGLSDETLHDGRKAVLDGYKLGLDLYQAKRFAEAAKAFEATAASDIPSKLYLERCQHFETHPPKSDWDGVWELTEK